MIQDDFFSMFLEFDVNKDQFSKAKVCNFDEDDEDGPSDCHIDDYRNYFCNALNIQLSIFHTNEKGALIAK